MSQRNPETEAMGLSLALVGVAAFAVMFVLYAVVCFAAIVFTILALCALKRPVTIFGATMTQREARMFLIGGVVGIVSLSLFSIFCATLLKTQVQPSWWPYLWLGGYSVGAILFASSVDEHNEQQQAVAFLTIEQPGHQPRGLPSAEAPPFRFATWDDKERRS